MPVYLPTAVLANDQTLITLGHSAEIMGWFFPSKDHAQHVHEFMPCVYIGPPHGGRLSWTWGWEWDRRQEYRGDSNILVTTLCSHDLGLSLEFADLAPLQGAALVRRITVGNTNSRHLRGAMFHFADLNMGGFRTGDALRFDRPTHRLIQSHHDAAAVIGGSALESWHCGKAGMEWGNNARYAVEAGALYCNDLEIGDVNLALGFAFELDPGQSMHRVAVMALGRTADEACSTWDAVHAMDFAHHQAARTAADQRWIHPGIKALWQAAGCDQPSVSAAAPTSHPEQSSATGTGPTPGPESNISAAPAKPPAGVPIEIYAAYKRSLLCLPLICGSEGVPLAAPEFDPEFISCGGYGYFWPRDGGEYVSGLLDAGYPWVADGMFDWCARHQDSSGLWGQRYFLNGEPGPNWCLPPDMLQIDQVGAVLWAYGKALDSGWMPRQDRVDAYHAMLRRAAEYLVSRQTELGVHANAFDTWESFVGSFSYSNASVYAALKVAGRVLGETVFSEAAGRVKDGVLTHFVRDDYLIRGFNGTGGSDETVDSSSLGAIEPFGLLDLENDRELAIARGTLRIVSEKLECDWEGGRAIRRFEWDAYVGGVPACVNTLWMARCCLKVADRLDKIGQQEEARRLTSSAQTYLCTVLRRSTPTGLLPELMQGPTGQRYWAAPHGWAMASFVSGVLALARRSSGS